MDKKTIDEMARDIANSGKVASELLCEETKTILREKGNFKSTERMKTLSDIVAEELAKMGYRKIPEGAVVLTKEENQKYLAFKIIEPQVRGCLDREYKLEKQVRALDDELNLAKRVLSYDDAMPLAKWEEQLRKETAEKFAERVKMAFYYHFDELIPSIMADKIDEICKEIIEEIK